MNLLLAVDDSQPSEAAIREVLSRPWPEGTCVRVLSVAPERLGSPVPGPPIGFAGMTHEPVLQSMLMDNREMLRDAAGRTAQRAAEQLEQHGLRVDTCVREGSAGSEIVQEAGGWPADLIVVGSRGHGGFARLLLGSTASHVLHHAPCSIEIVRKRERSE
jgi:nucleotide-binding universal stress UspA family protein